MMPTQFGGPDLTYSPEEKSGRELNSRPSKLDLRLDSGGVPLACSPGPGTEQAGSLCLEGLVSAPVEEDEDGLLQMHRILEES
jgi:hypothetical protein